MKSITVDVNRPFRITIGNAREDSALQVNFDFAGWVEDYGSGSISLLVKRNGDSDPYPVLLDTEGTTATWDISNVDTDKVGVGEAQLIYTTDDVLKKSTVFTFDVVRALDDGTTPPDPYVTLIEQMTELATSAQDAADDAEDYRDAASGYATDAQGYKNDASGYATQASGYASDAQGYANEAKGYRNTASGYADTASGYASDAQGYASDAQGYKNDASGYASSASGYASDAQGYASDAQGYKNDASGYASQASGYASDASGYADSASGYADAASDSADDAQEYANSIGENLAPVYDEDESYDIGDYCFYDGSLYVCIAETTGEWDSDDWRSVSMAQVFKDLVAAAVPTSVRQAIYTLLRNAVYTTTGLTDEIATVESWSSEAYYLVLSESTLTLEGSVPQTLTATVVPSSATITWSSSDSSIATVSNGIVIGQSNGSCVISAAAGNLTANCTVTVSGFATVVSISAVYTKTRDVLESDALESIKHDLVVTATYEDTSVETIPSNKYGMSGTLATGTSTITVYYSNKTTTFNVTVLAGLPVDYKRVEYIHSSDMSGQYNGAYIDTGRKFGSSFTTARFLVGIKADSLPSSWTDAICAISVRQTGGGSSNNHGLTIGVSAGNLAERAIYSFGGVTAAWYPEDSSELASYHDLVVTRTSTSITLKVDDNDPITESGTLRAIANGYNISLFAAKNNTQAGATYMYKGRMYYAIADQDDTEIFHGIPCVRLSDSKPGMYDIVNSSFRTATSSGSQGSADIIKAGPDFE